MTALSVLDAPAPWLPYDVLSRRLNDAERQVMQRALVVADGRAHGWQPAALDALYAAVDVRDVAYRVWQASEAARKAAREAAAAVTS